MTFEPQGHEDTKQVGRAPPNGLKLRTNGQELEAKSQQLPPRCLASFFRLHPSSFHPLLRSHARLRGTTRVIRQANTRETPRTEGPWGTSWRAWRVLGFRGGGAYNTCVKTGSSSHVEQERSRRRLAVQGRVQGVGFRPFVCRLACDLRLGGFVGNDTHGAFIEVEGPASAIDEFERRLRGELPPLARIAQLTGSLVASVGETTFRIIHSSNAGQQDAEITPDTATCPDCLRELFDPADRRFRYPFINCTNCGPRYSIIQAVPYDRPNTTMQRFVMCPACQAEYDDPANRRFHAQPNACPVCGPRVWLCDTSGREIAGDAIRLCAERLRDGAIVAIKGIGGFHLACRADRDEPVVRLRERKMREAKPLAIMVASLEAVGAIAEVYEVAAVELSGPVRPIVLLPKKPQASISRNVAPGNDCLGIMLPYTPLHHLLMTEGVGPLVMTSANPTDEPLCSRNDEALERLAEIADAFLMHDRDIERRVDDSVAKLMSGATGERVIVPIRRARGLAPAPIRVPVESPMPVLAVGGELKSAVCILSGGQAVLSEHLGELENPAAFRNFTATIEQFKKLLRVEPRVVACDMHPDYAATRYAATLGLPVTEVQHHHAHIVSCMAEAGVSGRVIGVSCDGTGYGTDGAIWGCEILVCDEAEFERAGHLRYFRLVGGDQAAKDTWRPAAGLLRETFGQDWRQAAGPLLNRIDEQALSLVDRRLTAAHQIPWTSSLGRLFDGVAFLLGICDRNRYEAEAAMDLEAAARAATPATPLAYSIEKADDGNRPAVCDFRPMVKDMLARLGGGEPAGALARAFHETCASMLADVVGSAAIVTGIRHAVLSGGCFANRLLLGLLTERLTERGFRTSSHREVPTGDGGIALGQAVVAAERVRRGLICV
ncbi:MAG: carbamoyltransferase HypF [Planctomycetes bacterium]|nr:carbamoyltransferase HypF [Planctomycetota bacterium]